MIATTRPAPTPEPEPPTPGAALAVPCKACGTTGGFVQKRCVSPWRTRGYCKPCYVRLLYHGLLDVGQGDCLSCGKTRAAVARGLCSNCYNRARDRGTVKQYPACGRVPVPFADRERYGEHPTPLPAGLSPILWPDRARPVWTGLALVKYPAPTWHTYRPRGRRLGEAA